MGNMSYCRFQNTSQDLADCENALTELLGGVDGDGEDAQSLSLDETYAAKRLVRHCINILQLFANELGLGALAYADDDDELLDTLERKYAGIIDTANVKAGGATYAGGDVDKMIDAG